MKRGLKQWVIGNVKLKETKWDPGSNSTARVYTYWKENSSKIITVVFIRKHNGNQFENKSLENPKKKRKHRKSKKSNGDLRNHVSLSSIISLSNFQKF